MRKIGKSQTHKKTNTSVQGVKQCLDHWNIEKDMKDLVVVAMVVLDHLEEFGIISNKFDFVALSKRINENH